MKKRDLERHLHKHNCHLYRDVGRHEVWVKRGTKLEAAVPRHREIPFGTVRAICRQVEIPIPEGR